MGNRMLTETLHARLPVLQNRSLVSPCFLDTGKKKINPGPDFDRDQ